MPLPPKAELEWWYQYYFATERGRIGYEKNRREFAKLIWQACIAEMEFRRCHFRAQRAGLRQSRPRRDRDPQLSLAALAWPTASEVRRPRGPAGRRPGHRCADHHHGKRRQRRAASRSRRSTRRSSPASTSTGMITGGIGHNLPQEAPQRIRAGHSRRRRASVTAAPVFTQHTTGENHDSSNQSRQRPFGGHEVRDRRHPGLGCCARQGVLRRALAGVLTPNSPMAATST